jgi:hypothetical protein
MRVKGLFSLFLFFFTISCAVREPFGLYDNKIQSNAGQGVIVCSLVHGKNGLTRPDPAYFIRRIGSTEEIRIFGHNKLFEVTPDFNDGPGPGVVKILQLPAGKYEFFKWDLFYNLGLAQWHEVSDQVFSIPFEVKADALNYLGQLTLENHSFQFADRESRDLEKAWARNNALRDLPMNKQELRCSSGCLSGVKKTDQVFQMPYMPPAKS